MHLPSQDNLEETAKKYSKVLQAAMSMQYEGYNYSFSDHDLVKLYKEGHSNSLGPLRNFLISCLGTEGRLGIVYPPQVAGEFGKKDHPIQYLADSPTNQRAVSDIFQQAFGCPLTVDMLKGDTLPLRLGSWPDLDELQADDLMELVVRVRAALATLDELQDQGDGMRSFAGIILNLLIAHCLTFVVDEPESFLHPPQAYILGRIIGKLLGANRQCILATHSRDIICGLLESCPQRVKFVRITRFGNTNRICVLDSEAIDELWADPILKYSNIMDAMFHELVVICESDADCMMYSLVYTHISAKSDHDVWPLFVHCGGKHRMVKIVDALQALEIPFRVVPDLDLLNNEHTCKRLYEACGGDWSKIESDFRVAYSSIAQRGHKVSRADLSRLLEQHNDRYLSNEEIKGVSTLLNDGKPWTYVKTNGFGAFPGGDATKAAMRLNNALKQVGIFLVPVGELEMFNKTSGKHGPAWVLEVLEANPDIGDAVYDEIRAFVTSWGV